MPIAYADDTPTLLRRCGQTDFDLCGFIDAKIWNAEGREVFIIEPRFENAGGFSEGLAAVRVDGNYGYIDLSGQVAIRPQFTHAGLFDQGLAVAGTSEKLGIIDNSGNYVVDPMFSQAVVFSNQVILAQSIENSEYRGSVRIH
ncbi:MAG: WG repeat-containing protein, partial [Proteobacteria bacterium]|nr:WG repeat-containing protein [Pseudomonadota bacterium]